MAKREKHAESSKRKSNIYSSAGERQAKDEGTVRARGYRSNRLHEAGVPYGSTIIAAGEARMHGGHLLNSEVHIVPAAAKIAIIKNGISKKELETVKEESNLDYDTLSNILSVSKAKLHGKKGAEKFDQNTSERIMLLADVVAYGQSVFEDKDSFNEWLKTSNTALGNVAPVELMDTIYGIDEVKKEIGRIEYGIF
ncbi:MAG TPA: antitoxin Xre/MbcA/ParS toxin-binding domain-containing protein [Parafilimonas sp.]|nr:antitoxin Xre/MbcA/ParS toxin-binding domain-containing protein [Parafilimonas sp.]